MLIAIQDAQQYFTYSKLRMPEELQPNHYGQWENPSGFPGQ